ncbi:addiction module protein [Paludisphaera sp.]|uniref:addiction module protein n=1 Tax=Paludisphaera sp. TaxID=2017432 RepID=UPI00301DB8D4
MQAVLSEVRNWTVEDRIRLIEELWDGLPETDEPGELSDDLRAFLDRRIVDADANPDASSPLEDVWSRVASRYER